MLTPKDEMIANVVQRVAEGNAFALTLNPEPTQQGNVRYAMYAAGFAAPIFREEPPGLAHEMIVADIDGIFDKLVEQGVQFNYQEVLGQVLEVGGALHAARKEIESRKHFHEGQRSGGDG